MSSVEGPMYLKDKNEALLDEILDLLDSPDCENPEVILLIGRSGAGKSAFVNTIHKVLTGKYYGIADEGSGDAATVTTTLNRYENCGVKLHRIADGQRKEEMLDKINKLPHLIDCAGLADENTRKIREVIELLLGGYIPPDTSMLAIDDFQKTYGEGGLEKVFKVSKPAWRVTKIVFMQGCIDAIPKNLLECLRDVLNIYDENTLKKRYRCRLFVLITKYDLVKDSSDANHYVESKEAKATLKDLEKIEQEIAQQLSFIGAIRSKVFRWVNFTDNIGLENLHVENCVLTFLRKIVEPGPPKAEHAEQIIGFKQKIVLNMHTIGTQLSEFFLQDIQISFPKMLIFVAIMVAVLASLYYLLQQNAATQSPGKQTNANES